MENEIGNLSQCVRQNAQELKNAQFLAQKQQEELRTVQTTCKSNIQNEAEAMRKAEELAKKNEAERREAQKLVQNLAGQEQEARKKLHELNTNTNVTVEQKPATVDVYEHRRYETSKWWWFMDQIEKIENFFERNSES